MLPLPVNPSYALHLSVLHFLLFCIPVLQILYSYAVRDFLRNYSEPGETDLKTTWYLSFTPSLGPSYKFCKWCTQVITDIGVMYECLRHVQFCNCKLFKSSERTLSGTQDPEVAFDFVLSRLWERQDTSNTRKLLHQQLVKCDATVMFVKKFLRVKSMMLCLVFWVVVCVCGKCRKQN